MTTHTARTRITRTLATAAIALTALAGGAASATAAPSAPSTTAPHHDAVSVAIQPQDGGGARQWQYWDWYWWLGSCLSAGNSGEWHGIWSDYSCIPTGTPGNPSTTYNLYVYR